MTRTIAKPLKQAALALLFTTAFTAPANAQADRVSALEAQVAEQNERIARLEALIAQQTAALERLGAGGQAQSVPGQAAAPAAVAATPAASPAPVQAAASPAGGFAIPGLDVGGDVRVRQEFNFSDADARDRTRTVARLRLRATYKISDNWAVGGQIATGDPDDPNSTDITLTGFDDDLDASFDQVWIRYQNGGLTAYAGKFPQIFVRTDMVWDGDVVPQGFGATYAIPLGGGAKLDARGIYFVIDENTGGRDSAMLGGQAVLELPLDDQLKLSLAGAYYAYRLHSLAGGDAGDFRSNLMAGGRYLSDFRLIDAIGTLSWRGLGERWPLTLTGEYVKNTGAAVSSDDGFNVELSAGRTAQKGDWRLFYNYSQVGVDAVFAAFSQDNIGLATNYRLHGFSVDHVLRKDVLLNATLYHYRPLDALYAGLNQPHDWLNRVRLNLMLNF